MSRKVVLIGLVILAFSLFVVEKPAISGQKDATQATGGQVSTPPDSPQKSTSAYEYSGIGRRDPFTPLVMKKGTEREKRITPLESYAVGEIKLIAILWEKNRYYAVVTLPDNKSYTVADGTKVGINGGVVSRITKDSMVISERVRDRRGRISPKNTVLKLRVEEEQ